MKKRLLLVVVLVISSAFLVSCSCSNEQETNQPTQDEAVGAYTQERDVTAEDLAIFDEAMESMAGVGYVPLKVSTQVVSGTNYKFYCETLTVTAEPEEGHAYVTIYVPLDGKPEVTDITEA